MAKYTNTLGRTLTLSTGNVKDGVHETVDVRAGESVTISNEMLKHPQVAAYVRKEVLTQQDGGSSRASAAPAAPASRGKPSE